MKWKQKALIYNMIGKLPTELGYATHYFMQRGFGGMRRVDPSLEHVQGAIDIVRHVMSHGGKVEAKTFLEIGPGRHLTLPITLWLCGASRVITIDANPYLKTRVVFDYIAYMRSHRERIFSMLGSIAPTKALDERFRLLMGAPPTLDGLLSTVPIEYLAQVDAGRLDIPDAAVDYYISYNVLEFIPPAILQRILREGKRVLAAGGLHIHSIDFSDWFSASDKSISGINFLQFSDGEWNRYAGNRFMYHNRMRIDDFTDAFETAGLHILSVNPIIDEKALQELKTGFLIDERFRDKPPETNATRSAWVVAAPEHS